MLFRGKKKRSLIFLLNTIFITALVMSMVPVMSTSADSTPSSIAGIETDNQIKVEETLGVIEGKLTIPESISKVKVLLYEQDGYNDKSDEIESIDINKKGEFEFKDIKQGKYRLNFVCEDKDFDAELYQLVEKEEESKDKEEETEDIEVKYENDKEYFLYANINVKEQTNLEIEIEEISNATKIGQSIEELRNNKPYDVGATVVYSSPILGFGPIVQNQIGGDEWSFDMYYVGENNKYHVEKDSDFPLKYQMEFHTSRDLEQNAVMITVPLDSIRDRENNPINPTQIAIPQGTPQSPVQTSVTPFNYYIEDGNIVFFNYKTIIAGANVAWQILYKEINVMIIEDGTEWTIDATVSVDIENDEGQIVNETEEAHPLTGQVDTGVNLKKVSKTPKTFLGKNYGPGLYTKKQVEKYTGPLPPKYSDGNFNDYVYIIWDFDITFDANQAWNLLFKDTTDKGGEVLVVKDRQTSNILTEKNNEDYYISEEYEAGKDTFKHSVKNGEKKYAVVCAYPKNQVSDGVEVTNTLDVNLEPYDGKDPVQTQSDVAKWVYKDYQWTYTGEFMGVEKYTGPPYFNKKEDTQKGWLDIYEGYQNESEDKGGLKYRTRSKFKTYEYTHYLSGDNLGERIPNTTAKSITVDDVLYAFSPNSDPNIEMLTQEDYYFKNIEVKVIDRGYDVFEDNFAAPEPSGPANVYVMNYGEDDWTFVEAVDWNPSGELSYTLTESELAGEPYRVKVEHDTVNYEVECEITVDVAIRHDSPVFAQFLNDGTELINVQNLSGVYGEVNNNGNISYVNDYTPDDYTQYPESLSEETIDLYGFLIEREFAKIDLTTLKEVSDSRKTAITTNDFVNGRVDVRYNVTAYDGYELSGQDAIKDINKYRSDINKPGRDEVVFYDLLPYGVKFDPSKPIFAGITKNLTKSPSDYTRDYKSWDAAQVNVVVDDVDANYKNTGRTMVTFRLTYGGADVTFVSDGKWVEGWGVSFGAYYDWKDVNIIENAQNISAFMAAEDDTKPLLGDPFEDDGQYPDDIYNDFGTGDINQNGRTDDTVLFADCNASEIILNAGESRIDKLVKADADKYAPFTESTAVDGGKGYTYDITIRNGTGAMQDIVFFDRLENSIVDRQVEEPGAFDDEDWKGTFNGLQLRALDERGIKYKVYYNAQRDATVPEPQSSTTPASVLTQANGWFEAEDFLETSSLAAVKAFAVDISTTTNDENFILDDFEAIGFEVKMIAPESSDAIWAYNNASFYRKMVEGGEEKTVAGNSVKVKLGEPEDLEIIKNLASNTPESLRNTKFEFTISRDGKPLKNIGYSLYDKVNDGWEKSNKLYATDANGVFKITASQKVIFEDITSLEDVTVKEATNPFWDVEQSKVDNTITFTNTYQPILYAQKKVDNVPEGVDISDDEFRFRLTASGAAVSNKAYFIVDSVRTDGGIPEIIDTLYTDDNGEFNIKPGQIIALLPGDVGINYQLTEVGGAGPTDNWFVEKDTVSGTLNLMGSSATITNHYKLKDILLTKEITNQDPGDCTQEFTFRVLDSSGSAVIGNKWVVLDSSGNETSTGGILSGDGEFTAELAGKTVKICDLTAGEKYTIHETESGNLYEPVNGGMIEVKMPKYAENVKATMTNDYLKRPLSISKQVLYDLENSTESALVGTKEFTMTVTLEGSPLVGAEYILYENGEEISTGVTDENGQLKLKHGQTATFPEVGMKGDSFVVEETPDRDFPQIYPSGGDDHIGKLNLDNNSVTFINGEGGALILEKSYTGEDAFSRNMIDAIKQDSTLRESMAVSLALEITSGNENYTYPIEDTEVNVIDTLSGISSTILWEAGKPIVLKPWEKIILTNLNEDDTYKLTESKADQKRMYEYNNEWVQIKQSTPADYQPSVGTVESDPVATVINSISKVETECEINKKMKLGSNDVPEGAELIWRLEEFDGNGWNPKPNVSYLTFDSEGVTCNEVLKTGNDGLILLTKTSNGYPTVKFTDTQVKINVDTGAVGTLRLVEVLADSDDSWGQLSGYMNTTMSGLNVPNANTFVNSNNSTTVQFAKEVEGPSDDDFTFILSQVIKANEPIATESDILKTTVHGGITYTVYDKETMTEVSTGVTTAKGEIKIKGGQYVKIDLPSGTYWTLSENVTKPYELTSLDIEGDMVTKLADNLVLFAPVAPIDAEEIMLTRDMVIAGVIDAETGLHVTLNTGDIVIPEYIIHEGKLRVITYTDNLNSSVFPNPALITSVKLPSTFKNIGNNTFNRCENLEGELIIPKSVTRIGNGAFSGCNQLSGNLVIPGSVTIIGVNAFRMCTGLDGVTISEGVETIDRFAFYSCTNLSGTLTIPGSVKTIESSAFSGCSGLDGLTISNGVETIGGSAFYNCKKITGSVHIPDSVENIGESAFRNCSIIGPDIYIGSGIQTIGQLAFATNSISNIYIKASFVAGAHWGATNSTVHFNSTH